MDNITMEDVVGSVNQARALIEDLKAGYGFDNSASADINQQAVIDYIQEVEEVLKEAESDINDIEIGNYALDIDLENKLNHAMEVSKSVIDSVQPLIQETSEADMSGTPSGSNVGPIDMSNDVSTELNVEPTVESTVKSAESVANDDEISSVIDDTPVNNESETLISQFNKYFDNTPANILRSVDFGKHVYRYFVPDVKLPKEPETLLNMTKEFLNNKDENFTDKDFVRLVIDKVNNNPGLITFDMIADIVESDAYKNFGDLGRDHRMKQKFESWVRDKSLLSKVDMITATDVVLNEDSLKRVVNALVPEKNRQKYIDSIDKKVQEFDNTYTKKLETNLGILTQLESISKSQNADGIRENALQKVSDVYGVLCDPKEANLINEEIDVTMAGAPDLQTKNMIASGWVHSTNKTLNALEKRALDKKLIAKNDIKETTIDELPFDKKVNGTQTQPQKKRINPILDVARTYAVTLGGAAAVSAISSIPVVGKVVGSALGVVGVLGAGVTTAINEYKKAKNNPEFTRSKLKDIARKSGIAMVKKAIPYAAAVTLGPVGRTFGAVAVAARTLFEDLEYRAEKQQQHVEQVQQEKQAKGIKGFFGKVKKIGQNMKKVGVKESLKSFAYAATKGAVVYFGAQHGVELGEIGGDALVEKFTTNDADLQNVNGGALQESQQGLADTESLNANPQTYTEKYLAEHPGSYVDKNGWVCNADGSYARNETGQLFGTEDRVFRGLRVNETLDSSGNIVESLDGMGRLATEITDVTEKISNPIKAAIDTVRMPNEQVGFNNPDVGYSDSVNNVSEVTEKVSNPIKTAINTVRMPNEQVGFNNPNAITTTEDMRIDVQAERERLGQHVGTSHGIKSDFVRLPGEQGLFNNPTPSGTISQDLGMER